MAKETQKKWDVGLTIVDEDKPPKRVITNTETQESYDLYSVITILLEKIESIEGKLDKLLQ